MTHEVKNRQTLKNGDLTVVDGFGSYSLEIPERNAAQVSEFIKGLDGVEAEKVTYVLTS